MAEDYLPFGPQTPLPDARQVEELWDRYEMLENIREHSRVVTWVALLLTDWLEQAGVYLHRWAVESGALLHDIAKTQCLGTSKLHAQLGREIMEQEGFPELAQLVGRHVYLPDDQPLDETLVVNYADKRVTHDKVVSLAERYDYIQERYGQGDPMRIKRIEEGRRRIFAAERLIFGAIKAHTPDEVGRLWQGAA